MLTVRCCLVSASALAGIFISSGSSAQSADASAQPRGSSAQTPKQPAGEVAPSNDREIVITAQKRSERLQDVPISVSVLTGRKLDSQEIGGVTEALRTVPALGVAGTAQGGATQLSIRGVSSNGATLNGASTVAYYLDGVPFGLVKSSILPDTNAYDLERIEVLRGPQGTLYGANALNGVVRVLTHDADPSALDYKFRTGISTTQGGDISYRGDAAINVPLVQDSLAVRLVAGYEKAGGWIDQPNRNVEDANSSRSRYVRAKLNGHSGNFEYGLSAWISRITQNSPNYADDAGNQYTTVPLVQKMNFDAYNGTLKYHFPTFTLSSATSYLKFANAGDRDYTFLAPLQTLFTDIRSKVFTEELLANSSASGDWKWSGGVFYRNAKDILYQTLFVLPAPIDFGDNSKSFAVFGEVTRKFDNDRFEATGGLRYFRDKVTQIERSPQSGDPNQPLGFRSDVFKAVTPRAVLTWLPNKNFTAYTSYSQGFRSGFNQSPVVIRTAPEVPPVKADKLSNYEAGLKTNPFGGMLSVDAAVFYIKWKDVVQQVNLPYQGVLIAASINGPSASGWGTDLAVTVRPVNRLSLGGTFSYSGLTLDAPVITALTSSTSLVVYKKGERLSYSPKYTASAFADYSFPLGSGFDGVLSGSLNYRSKITGRRIAGGQVLVYESDAPLIARASFTVRTPNHWTATLFVDNATNWDKLLQAPTDVSQAFRARPRTFGFQLAYRR
jgi:outer membrane receptor protein involved in Fe transport